MRQLLRGHFQLKNSLSNNNGYSPAQLVLGKNPNLPNFIENNLPAQEPSTKSFHIATRLTALHAARKAFIESESSNKLKTALRKNTRSFFNTYNIGDEVFYKRNDSPEWKGPGKVLGQDGSVLFIRQGLRYIKVHLCRVQPVHMQNIESSYSDNTPNIESSYSDNTPNTDTNANKQQNDNENEFETEEEASQNDADEQTSSIQQDYEQSNSNQQVNLSTLK